MGNSADRAWQLSQLVEGVLTAFNPSHGSLSCVQARRCVSKQIGRHDAACQGCPQRVSRSPEARCLRVLARAVRVSYRTAAAAACQCGRGADKKKSMQPPITVGNGNCWLWLKQSRARVCRPSGLQSFRHRNRHHATLRNVPQRCILETPVWIFIPGAIRNS